jgi:anti-sigma-K factor RskA
MSSPGRKERELVFDYCLGLISAEEATKVEAWIACNEQAAAFHTRIMEALEPLERLPCELCPQRLAERTIRCLCARAREAQTPAPSPAPSVRPHDREEFWLCLSNNILMTLSS